MMSLERWLVPLALSLVGLSGADQYERDPGRVAKNVSDETTTALLSAGQTGVNIASAMTAAWSQAGVFGCGVSANTLSVVELLGNCDDPVTTYTFTVADGTLMQGHTLELRVKCASPVVASVQIDGGGFMTLALGPNVFTSGPDTITIGYAIPPPVSCPSTSAPQLYLLAALLAAAGWLLARLSHARSSALDGPGRP